MSKRPFLAALAAAAAIGLAPLPAIAQPQGLPATSFNVVGSIGNLSMYLNREVPFWNETVPKESAGAIKVQLKSFTELGLKGPEIFRLVSSGTLQFATTVLNYNSGEVPMNEAADLVGLVGSVEELQKTIEVLRPSYAKFLEEKHGLKLLGFGTYQAQVIYCRDAFTNVADLKGRKVRASGASQQAFVSHLGGSPITIAFAEVQPALASGVIDCAITGALSGYRSKCMNRRSSSRRCRSTSALPPTSPTSPGGKRSIRKCRRSWRPMSRSSKPRSSSRPRRKPRPGSTATPAAPPARRASPLP